MKMDWYIRALSALLVAGFASVPSFASAQRASADISGIAISGLPSDFDDDNLTVDNDNRRVVVNIGDCLLLAGSTTELSVAWTFEDSSPNGTYRLKIQSPGEACDTTTVSAATEDCSSLLDGSLSNGTLTVGDLGIDELLPGITDESCASATSRTDYLLHLVHSSQDSDVDTDRVDTLAFTLDLSRPSAPTDITSTSGETQIRLRWEEIGGIEDYRAYYSADPSDFAGVTRPEDLPSSVRSQGFTPTANDDGIMRGNLEDGISVGNVYTVALVALSDEGNPGLIPATLLEVSTQATADFFETYRDAGGVETGGYCASSGTGGALGGLVFLLGLLGLRRRRDRVRAFRVSLPMAVAAGVLFAPIAADAGIRHIRDSSITGALELKLGLNSPAIDSEFDGSGGPFEEVFGDGTNISFELEYNRQFWRGFGSLGAFVGAGISGRRGDAINEDGTSSDVDRARLRTIPLRAGLVYRFDVLQERYNVPFVISAKVGIDWILYWALSSGGVSDHVDAEGERSVGRGGTTGFHASFGLHFLLDSLAPQMAQNFDTNVGVDNSYLFAEIMLLQANDFGGSQSWDMSDTVAMFGLAFEF
ncbi:MAG: hypothetical protein ACI81R_001172 [Bradymonadia bacterium]|jgi:hypothetical protein